MPICHGLFVAALMLAVIVQHCSPAPAALLHLATACDIGDSFTGTGQQHDGRAPGMLYPMLLQQEKELFPALPRNLLIFFLVLSFAIPLAKYIFRLIKVQVQELLAAAANEEEEELLE